MSAEEIFLPVILILVPELWHQGGAAREKGGRNMEQGEGEGRGAWSFQVLGYAMGIFAESELGGLFCAHLALLVPAYHLFVDGVYWDVIYPKSHIRDMQ